MTQPINERFYYSTTFPDTTPNATIMASLYQHVVTWQAANLTYAVQWTTIQPDIIRYPFSGGPYCEVIWYAELIA